MDLTSTGKWIIGILVAIAISLIGVIFFGVTSDSKEIKKDAKEAIKDVRHEMQILRHAIDELQNFERDWRHSVYQPAISMLQIQVIKLQEKVEQLEKLADRILRERNNRK